MKLSDNDIYIQRGESFALDFCVNNKQGDPLMLFKKWRNPYLVITVSTSLYKQEGSSQKVFWLDLSKRYVEQKDGSLKLEDTRTFINTEALYLGTNENDFTIQQIIALYGKMPKITINPDSDFDIKNYLFYVENSYGERTYKYVKSYKFIDADNDNNGFKDYEDEVWEEYSFRIVKQFETSDWMVDTCYYDMKVLAGESVAELYNKLDILSDEKKEQVLALRDSNVPLMPDYDVQMLILKPTKIHIGVNLQGGNK